MILEDCLKENGTYYLLECKDHLDEFRVVVKDNDHKITSILYGKERDINQKEEILLLCDLHESEEWEKE